MSMRLLVGVVGGIVVGGGLAAAQDVPPHPDPFGGGTRLYTGPRRDVYAWAGPGWPGGGFWASGFPYGPRVAPAWGYPGLGGGPFVGYAGSWPVWYSARAGSIWSNGLSLYGPPVPTYGPLPGVLGNDDLQRLWRAVPSPGIPFGWFGIYSPSPRPRVASVDVWPRLEGVSRPTGGAPVGTPTTGGCLVLSVKVPQPAAEVYVNGVRTHQTGTDRLFESPVLPADREYRYDVRVRWFEGGVWREQTRSAVGRPGEVVRLDFTTARLGSAGR